MKKQKKKNDDRRVLARRVARELSKEELERAAGGCHECTTVSGCGCADDCGPP